MLTNTKISLNPDGAAQVVPDGQKIRLAPETTLTGNSPEFSEDLAAKYHVALGEDSPGPEAMLSSITSGNERRWAELAAMRDQVAVQKARDELVANIASQGIRTPYDLEVVQGLSEADLQSEDIGTILEKKYADKFANMVVALSDEEDDTFSDAVAANPEQSYEMVDRSGRAATNAMIVGKYIDKVNTQFSKDDLLSQGAAWLQGVVPFRDWVDVQTALPELSGDNAFWPGDTKQAKYARMRQMDPKELDRMVDEYVKGAISSNNYLGALNFLQGFMSYSESDEALDDLFAGLDIATIVPMEKLAKVLKGVGGSAEKLKNAERIAVRVGNNGETMRTVFEDAIRSGKLPSQNIRNIADVERMLPSLFRPQEIFAGKALRAGGPAVSRLERAAFARAGKALEILSDTRRVERLTPEELDKAFTETEDFMRVYFTSPNHKVVDIKRNMAEDNIGNVYSVSMQIGKLDGSPLGSEIAARGLAHRIGLRTNDFKIIEKPEGGWVVEVTRNVDETSGGVRNVKVDTDNKLPDTFTTRFLGNLTGADVVLGKGQSTARGVAVFSGEHMGHLLEEFTRPFRSMGKTSKKEFEEFIIRDRDFVDPTNGRGRTRATMEEFEDAFYQMFNKLPTEEQMDAYNAFKQLNDLDWMIRDLDIYKQKARMGIENFSFRMKDVSGNSINFGFEGKQVKELPRGSKTPFRVAVVDDEGNLIKGKAFDSRSMSGEDWNRIDALIKDNYMPVQAYKGAVELNGENYNFVLVRNFKRDRVGMNNLNYKQGSHVIYKHPYYIKQPIIHGGNGRAFYNGDRSIFNARDAQEAQIIADKFNELRRMIKDRKFGIKKYIADNFPEFTVKDMLKMIKTGAIDLDTPVMVTKAGTRTVDSHNVLEGLRGEGRTVNDFHTADEFDLSRQVTGRFIGERDDANIETLMAEKNTIHRLDGDPIMSPLDTLRLSMSNMVDTHIIHDYRLKSVRDFTRAYSNILDGDQALFDTDGLSFIFDAKYRPGADPNIVKTAEAQRKAILSLFNNKTIVERQIDMYKEKIIRSVRSIAGEDVAKWVEDKALPAASNVDVAMRAFAFHSKMGFFNIRQMFLQSTAVVNISAIAPRFAPGGLKAASPLLLAANTKSKFARDIGRRLGKTMGISDVEFEEMVHLYRRSGFSQVGGEVSYIDNMRPPSLKKGLLGKVVLDYGSAPFRAGESFARSAAFATAYLERRAMKGNLLDSVISASPSVKNDMTGVITHKAAEDAQITKIVEKGTNPRNVVRYIRDNTQDEGFRKLAGYLLSSRDTDTMTIKMWDPSFVPTNDIEKTLHDHMLKNTYTKGVHQAKTVFLRRNENGVYGNDEQTVLHELFHGLTVERIRHGIYVSNSPYRPFVQELKEIRSALLTEINKLQSQNAVHPDLWRLNYAAQDDLELVTMGFTDKTVQSYLKNIRMSKRETLWDYFVNFVQKVFKIPREEQDALERLITVVDDLTTAGNIPDWIPTSPTTGRFGHVYAQVPASMGGRMEQGLIPSVKTKPIGGPRPTGSIPVPQIAAKKEEPLSGTPVAPKAPKPPTKPPKGTGAIPMPEARRLDQVNGLTRADEAWILQRAKDLTGNMTRDSNAAYQRGYGSIVTQFFGYQMRLMEQMLSKKLTNGEKARLFTAMSLMYGVPVATGMTFGVLPIREMIKDELAKQGIEYDNTIAEPFIDGFAATFLEFVGAGDYNVSEKYGPGGLTTFYDLLKGDAELSDILLGASGGIIGDTIKDSGGILKFIWETIDLNDQTNFPINPQELMQPLRNVSTINNIYKLYEAVNTGKWLSKNGNPLTDITEFEAVFGAMTGLDPERVSDAFNKIEALNTIKKGQQDAINRMVTDYRRALRLMKDGYPKEAAVLFSRVKADGVRANLTPRQMQTVWRRATDGEPLDQSVEDQYTKSFGAK